MNILSIFASLFVFQIWLERSSHIRYAKTKAIFGFSAISILWCMVFPLDQFDTFILDLRQVPIIIGSLYGGPIVAVGLFLLTLVTRYVFFGAEGYLTFLLMYLILTPILIFFSRKFLQLTLKRKIIRSTLVSFGFSIFTLVIVALFNISYLDANLFLKLVIFPPVSMAMIIYIVEIVLNNYHLRQELIKSEKLAVISHLAASISHEVRNPLTASRGFMQLLQQGYTSPEKMRTFLDIAIKELDRAEGIIQDYLTFAKPAEDKKEAINVSTEIKKIVEILQPLANMNSVELDFSLAPYLVFGEKSKFKQCVINVAKNAIEAMPEGGKLSLHVERKGDFIYLHVRDTGIGMSKEQVDRLGEPFFTTREKGTGLGMMVVYSIVDSFGGKVKVKSEKGNGTTFSILLPMYKNSVEIVGHS